MSPEEKTAVLALLRSPAYADLAVAQIWAILLDEDTYVRSRRAASSPVGSSVQYTFCSEGVVGEQRRPGGSPI